VESGVHQAAAECRTLDPAAEGVILPDICHRITTSRGTP
jgi:hypothetical protein